MPAHVPPTSPYRTLRRVAAGREAPYPGVLAQHERREPCLLVEAEALGPDWPGWRADPHGHVLAPLDVVRRGGGHDVVLEVCRERIDRFLDRRGNAHRPLSDGEAVTLGVSALRGLAELDEDGRRSPAQWWLTGQGRPLLATGVGDETAADAVCALLVRIAPPTAPAAWAHAVDLARADRVSPRALDDAEAGLFGYATARPLTTDLDESRTARSLAVDARPGDVPAADQPDQEPGWIARAARSVDADAADVVSRVTTALWRSGRRAPRPARVWLAATAAAAAVLAGGLLWPQPGDGSGWAADGIPPWGGEEPAATIAPTVPASTQATAPDGDLPATVDRLLDARLDCDGDQTCLGGVQADALRRFPPGPIDLPGPERQVTLLDDLGDIGVAEVGRPDGTPVRQIVVIARQNDRWLLRDVYDVAQQPSEG